MIANRESHMDLSNLDLKGCGHFDTNHKNHIDWETPEELRDRLYRRIRATILAQG